MKQLEKSEFNELWESKQFKTLRQRLVELEPGDIADLLADVRTERAAMAFRLLPKDLAVAVFDHMEGMQQNRLLESFTDEAARVLLEAMAPDDRAELLDEVPAIVARRLLRVLSPEERGITLQLLGYEEGSAGREMTPLFVDLHSDMTVEQALARIRQLAINRETIYECYVTDGQRRLLGSVSLKDLVLSASETKLAEILNPRPPMVFTHTDREEVVKVLRDHKLLAVPVVDREQRLVGIITYDDVAYIVEEEVTEDVYRFGAVPGTERGYFTSRIFGAVRRRIFWLFLLLLVNTVTGSIIAGQEVLLGEVIILAAFIPLLIGTGGNVGAQSATVVIRGLATGEISPKRAATITLREIGVGALLGSILGLIVLLWAYILGRDLQVAAVVSITLLAISTLAALTGASLPFVFRLVRVDPAFVSAPLITTVMDISGLAIYFFVATMIVRL